MIKKKYRVTIDIGYTGTCVETDYEVPQEVLEKAKEITGEAKKIKDVVLLNEIEEKIYSQVVDSINIIIRERQY